jgi:Protein of unknown function (DUF3285)
MDTSELIPEPHSETLVNKLEQGAPADGVEPKDSFVKLAMRNMVKKRTTSLFHFGLTIFGVLGSLLALAIAFH